MANSKKQKDKKDKKDKDKKDKDKKDKKNDGKLRIPLQESYDFVIVGAGTAGCLWANYLTRNHKYSVLVIEAGLNYDNDPLILNLGGQGTQVTPFPTQDRIGTINDIGVGAPAFTVLSTSLVAKYYWSNYTLPMPGVNNRIFLYGMGRLAGGTSAVNGALWIRPSPQGLQRWVDATGDQEFSMTNMIPRWREIETYIGTTPVPQVHGFNGPIKNRQSAITVGGTKVANAMVSGYGLPLIVDRNDPSTPFNIVNQVPIEQRADTTRSHSSREFLVPGVDVQRHKEHYDTGINGRDLLVLYGSTVTKIYWKKQDNGGENFRSGEAVAESVEFVRFGVSYKVNINKKLVLASGINSATILATNGIGPADQLAAAGIPIIFANSNVGRNIENHTNIGVNFSHPAGDNALSNPNSLFSAGSSVPYGVVGTTATGSATVNASGNVTAIDITNSGSGYTVAPTITITGNGSGATATAVVSGGRLTSIRVNAQGSGYSSLVPPQVTISSPPAGTPRLNEPREFNNNILARVGGSPTISNFGIAPMYPRSRGYQRIFKKDPLAPVLVDLQYLVDPLDVTDIIRFIRKAVSIITSIPGYAVTVPTPAQLATDTTLATFIRQVMGQNHHYSGSCRMGRTANEGVIDRFGNVFGTENIIIIDASGFPTTIDANLAGTVYPYALKLFQDLTRPGNPHRL